MTTSRIQKEKLKSHEKNLIEPKTILDDRIISKLVVQISHNCNLQCPYCCSDKGLFGKIKPQLMTASIISDSLELFSNVFPKIKTIYLFGGEPTINLDGIEILCKKVDELVQSGNLKIKPTVNLTTNGVNLTERFFELTKRYHIRVGVSIDGPQSIHDEGRMDTKGNGTFNKIITNVKYMKEITDEPSTISITYNPLHLKSNFNLWDILKILKEKTNIRSFTITPSFDTDYSKGFDPLKYDSKKVIDEITDVIKKSTISMTTEDPIIESHVLLFAGQFTNNNRQLNFCPAGRTYFSLAYDGVIYPCQNLPQDDNMKIGTIYDKDIKDKLQMSEIGTKLNNANTRALSELKGSWQDCCVKICPAFNLSETNSLNTLAPNRKMMYLSMAEAFGKAMYEILNDGVKFNRFLNNLNGCPIDED